MSKDEKVDQLRSLSPFFWMLQLETLQFHLCNEIFFLFKLDMLKQNNLKNEEELSKSKELLNLENKKVEELRKEL